MEIKEFRGYVDGELKYTFPLYWVDEIIPCFGGTALVKYYDETKEENKESNTTITKIEVDYINIK